MCIRDRCHLDTLTEDAEAGKEFIEKISSPFFKTYWQPNQFKKMCIRDSSCKQYQSHKGVDLTLVCKLLRKGFIGVFDYPFFPRQVNTLSLIHI